MDLLVLRGGAPHPLDDTWEYGLAARSLLAGHGFRTSMIHPPLWNLRDASLTVPVLVHGSLLPLAGAPLIAAFGATALDQAAWLAAAFAVIAAVCTARAVARHAGAAWGATAAALVTGSPVMLRMVHHDIAPAAGAAFVGLLLDLLARPNPSALLTGCVTGLGALVRPELLLTAPITGLALGARRAWPFVVLVALVMAPWGWHTFAATGSPLFNLSSYMLIAYTRDHPGLSPLWDFRIPLARWPATLAHALPTLPAKWQHLAPRAIKHMLMAPSPGLGLIAAVGAASRWRAPATRRLATAGLLAALIPFALCTATESSERYVAVFLPLWALGSVLGVERLAGAWRQAWPARVALLALLLPFTLTTFASETRQSAALWSWLAGERSALASRGASALRGRLLFSDTPDFAAWTTGRPALATTLEFYLAEPADPAAMTMLPARGGPLDEWFHADVRATPAPTHGAAAVDILSGAGATPKPQAAPSRAR